MKPYIPELWFSVFGRLFDLAGCPRLRVAWAERREARLVLTFAIWVSRIIS